MNLLDIFEGREPHQQAIDQLEKARIDHLKEKMDYYAKHGMLNDFQKAKAEHDEYHKIKDECMGYGGLGEAGIGQDLVTPQQRVQQSTPQKQTPVQKVAQTGKEAIKWLTGKGGPGREGPTYESQKKNSKEIDESQMAELDAMRQDLERMNERQFYTAYGLSKAAFQQKYRTLLKPATLDESQRLHVGDPIVVTAPNEFEGATGEIYNFSPSGSFVIVNLYNHGKHSMHLSDVEYNKYADQEEADDWYDESVVEGWQDFNKVEPYAVCLAGKPVKKFDYYEQARRFHDNWKQKLYREGDKAKADKITLMPLNLDESTGIHPKLVTVLKQRGYKGPYKLSKLPKWLASLEHVANGDDEIMVTGNDPEYDEWVVYNAYGPYAYGQEMGYQLGTATKVIKDTVPLDEAGSPAQQAAIAIAMKKAGKKPKQVDELDANTLKSYADKRGAQVAAMKADNPNPTTGSKEWIQQAVPAQQVSLAKRKIARKERQQGVAEDTGSWIVYDPETRQIKKRFKTHTAGKSYAKVHGLGFASSEYYFDRVKEKAVAEGQQPMNRNAVIQKLEAIYTELYKDEDPESYDLPAAVDYWHSLPADQLAMEFEDAIDRLKQSRGGKLNEDDSIDKIYQKYIDNGALKNSRAQKIHKEAEKYAGPMGEEAVRFYFVQRVYFDMSPGRAQVLTATRYGRFNTPSVAEAQTDYQKRRARERDVDAGRPVKPVPKNPQTDYARKRAKDKRDMELGEDDVDDFVKAGGKITYGKPQKGPRRPGLSLASRHIGGGGDKMKSSRTGRAGAAVGGKPVGIKEEQDNSGVERAILNRIMVAHTDLLMKFGPEKVMQAAEEVAYNVGDVDEIGTSDVSAYVNQVKQILGVEA